MLKQRILSTLKFFDLQDCPLTLLELHRFLLSDINVIRPYIDEKFELQVVPNIPTTPVALDELTDCLDGECRAEVVERCGFYCLAGRQEIIQKKLANYFYAFRREKLIKKYINFLRNFPFVHGVALGGSQAFGMPKPESDIDLLIFTEAHYMGLARIFVTVYFQILGLRRHGNKIANRFCLNHYIAEGKVITEDRNLYSAVEYARLRSLLSPQSLAQFQVKNRRWIGLLLPNVDFDKPFCAEVSGLRLYLEKLLTNKFGRWLERISKAFQYRRISKDEFIVVSDDELSFHPHNRKKQLFARFFGV